MDASKKNAKKTLLGIGKTLGIAIPASLLLLGSTNANAAEISLKTNNIIKTEISVDNNEVFNYLKCTALPVDNNIDIDHTDGHTDSTRDYPHADRHTDRTSDVSGHTNYHTNKPFRSVHTNKHVNRD